MDYNDQTISAEQARAAIEVAIKMYDLDPTLPAIATILERGVTSAERGDRFVFSAISSLNPGQYVTDNEDGGWLVRQWTVYTDSGELHVPPLTIIKRFLRSYNIYLNSDIHLIIVDGRSMRLYTEEHKLRFTLERVTLRESELATATGVITELTDLSADEFLAHCQQQSGTNVEGVICTRHGVGNDSTWTIRTKLRSY